MHTTLRVLLVNECEDEAAAILRHLSAEEDRVHSIRTDRPNTFRTALSEENWDVVVCAHPMPGFHSEAALALLRETGKRIPLIVVSRVAGEDLAVQAIKAGAADFLSKSRLPSLLSSVRREVAAAPTRELSAPDVQYRLRLAQCITDQTSDAIFVLDREGRCTFLNPAAIRIFGFAPDLIVGKVLHELLQPRRADGSPYLPSECPLHRSFTDGTGVEDHETMFLRDDGSELHVSCSTSPLAFQDSRMGVVCIARDITERKQAQKALLDSEARFHRLVAADVVGILIARAGMILEANDHYLQMIGYTREELARGPIFWKDITPPEYHALAESAVRELREAGCFHAYEMEYVRRDGSRVPVLLGGVVTNGAGETQQTIILAVDLTERRKLEDHVRQKQQLETLGQLAGGIAHDFNNQLTVIGGYSRMLLSDLDVRSPLRDPVIEISGAATRAAELTHQLLAFSRRQSSDALVVEINSLVTDAESILRRLIGSNIAVDLALSPTAGCIFADAAQIEHAILNLAINARDAMPEGGTLYIETMRLEVADTFTELCFSVPQGTYVSLTVTDTGTGMSQDVQQRIFEPFFTTKAQGKGTGLGLSAVYGIVQQSCGHIRVHSALGLGSSFRIFFPSVGSAADDASALPALQPSDSVVGGSETVLLVEDENGLRKLVRQMLERFGFHVIDAASGPEAIARASRHKGRIDVLLTDMVLPGMNGIEIARHIVGLCPGIAVLRMSGHAERLGREAAGTSYIQKPFLAEDLVRHIRRLVDRTG